MSNKDKIINLIIFSIFCALTYIGTFIMIPLPTGDKIHLGNLFCILAALLLGGLKGGLIGSIGMGLNDLHFYLDSPTTIIQTLILKFLMGIICGSIFKLLRTNNVKKFSNIMILVFLSTLFLTIFSITLYIYIIDGIYVNDQLFKIHILVPISALIFSILFIIGIIFINKKSKLSQYVLVSVSIATLFNIIFEFIIRIILRTSIDSYEFLTAVILSLTKIPASILTGLITTAAATIIYPLLIQIFKNKSYIKNYEGDLND